MSKTPRVTQAMIDLYDDYTHLTLDRRRFMDQLTRLAGSSAAAAAVLPLIAASPAGAGIVPEDDKRLATETIAFKTAAGEASGYLARPIDPAGISSAVIVIHENRGLNAHIKDVVRRIALEGLVALGPDFLSLAGGTPADEDKARELIGALQPEAALAVGAGAVELMRSREGLNGNVGAMGFCWGGGMVNTLAVNVPELRAGVVYYGRSPKSEDVARIKARMLLHYAGLDERINAGVPDYEKALKAVGVDYALHMYENVNHAFNNDTSAARYDKAAAELAWSRTVAFLKASLSP